MICIFKKLESLFCVRKEIERELNENEFLVSNIQDSFLKARVWGSYKWYASKAVKSKYRYYSLTIITILFPILSEIILCIPLDETISKVMVSVVLGGSTLCAALLTMLDVRHKWEIYRSEAEYIKNMLTVYYFEPDDAKKKEIMKELEKSYEDTHKKWRESFRKEEKQQK